MISGKKCVLLLSRIYSLNSKHSVRRFATGTITNLHQRQGIVNTSTQDMETWLFSEKELLRKRTVINQKKILLDLYLEKWDIEKSRDILLFLSQQQNLLTNYNLREYWDTYLFQRLSTLFKQRLAGITEHELLVVQSECAHYETTCNTLISPSIESWLLKCIMKSLLKFQQKEALIKERYSDYSPTYLSKLATYLEKKEVEILNKSLKIKLEVSDQELRTKKDENPSFNLTHSEETPFPVDNKSYTDIITENKFKFIYANNVDQRKPLYKIYDDLKTEEMKEKFLSDYHAFNQKKEFALELFPFRLPKDYFKNKHNTFGLKRDMLVRQEDLVFAVSDLYGSSLKALAKEYEDLLSKNPDALERIEQNNRKVSSKKILFKYMPLIMGNGKEFDIENTCMALVVMLLQDVLGADNEKHYATVTRVCIDLGRVLEHSIWLNQNQNQNQAQNQSVTQYSQNSLFTTEELVELGASLLDIFLQTCSENGISIVEHKYYYSSLSMLGVLKLTDNMSTQMSILKSKLMQMIRVQFDFPLLIPPLSWTSISKGGYYLRKNNMILRNDAEVLAYAQKANRLGYLDMVYECLDNLGSIGFAINNDFFKILKHYVDAGDGFLSIPDSIENLSKLSDKANNCSTPREKKEILKQVQSLLIQRQRFEDIIEQMGVYAKNGDVMYFAHAVDFRGRAYPITSGVSYMLQDCFRALLMFWKGKPLGKNGLQWLKIQLANVAGYDKYPTADKIKFINANLANIKDSAKNPVNGNHWWQQADKPWQTLAACIELTNALELPNPEQFVSHLAIYQDGSCNGLQHYAALGRDIEGAKEVNLLPNDFKKDVYSEVLRIVQQKTEQHLANDGEVDDDSRMMAKYVQPLLVRKMIKQSVMTSVYGVTVYGVRRQILEKIDKTVDEDADRLKHGQLAAMQLNSEQYEFFQNPQNRFKAAAYIAKLTFESLRTLFKEAKQIEDWLVATSFRIMRALNPDYILSMQSIEDQKKLLHQPLNSIIWTSKTGLPIVQPYRRLRKKVISTPLQKITLNIPNDTVTPVDTLKQMHAVAPNFIHSLDSTHMTLTCLAAKRNHITFTSVHDSYWTHACDVEKLNALTRQEFVKLYTDGDLIQDLRNEFMARYGNFWQIVRIRKDSEAGKEIDALRNKNLEKVVARSKVLGGYAHGEETKTETRGRTTHSLTLLYEMELEQKIKKQKKQQQKHYHPYHHHHNNVDNDVSDIITPRMIVEKFNEPVYMTSRSKAGSLSLYNDSWKNEKLEVTLGDYIPILVPLQIPKIPSKGHLDINQVLKSEYFFS